MFMNKLRKLPTGPTQPTPGGVLVPRESRTTALARAAAPTTVSATLSAAGPKVLKPLTPAEQYWAARALTAEALLSAQTRHREEVQAVESRRAAEVDAVRQFHVQRERKLELVTAATLVALAALIAALLYMLHASHARPQQSRWLAPMHFTIPVLSPFASVVEHESSVIGSRVIVVIVLVTAVVAYGCFRYWLSHRPSRQT
ncbi:hypothetical protein PHLGIDRAFT_408341 [Phlebiopsis gigantea 11061_1 CR5-6]|uniref:Uncharacterized protein n=1 Tax=Phlebiopsis gigantea (strain 11061_1 CR5-6) TaxID=745531 RepID=A0A0C3RZG2_PHLG1|nr:hypothetical protein PHLGIDRAFT_408341 [Phlebiopsis gigantea 11061_1 CR5-6]